METSVLLIGAVIIAICAVPIFILSRNSKKGKQVLNGQLQKLAADVNCKITESEVCSDFVLGVDAEKKYVFYYKKLENDAIAHTLNAKLFSNCKVATSYQSGAARFIDRVDLIFVPANATNKEIRFPFYNAHVNIQIGNELMTAEAWAKKIQQLIATK